jgi:thymidylate kinase
MVSRIAIIVGRKFFLRNKDMFGNYDAYLRDKRNIYKQSSIAVKMYISIIIAEYLVQVFFKVTVPTKLGYDVISDRYFYDTVINDIAVDRGLSFSQTREIFARYWPHIPKPDATFLVEVPVNIAMSRKKDIPSLSYLEVRNEMYNEMASTYRDIIRLDGTLPIAKLQERVLEILNKLS